MVDSKSEIMQFREIKSVPRIRDVDLGRVLGMAKPTDIRRNIAKYIRDKKLNDFDVIAQRAPIGTLAEKGTPGRKSQDEFWLTEEAALFVGGRSDAPNATKIMRMLIAAFEELRKQNGAISHVLEFYFASVPSKLKERPFRDLIRALLRLRTRDPRKKGTDSTLNPAWGPSLASWVYEWSLKAHGQQQHRRALNPKPTGASVDYSWLTGEGLEACKRVIQTGTDFAQALDTWEDWKYRMEIRFGTRTVQLQLPVSTIPKRLTKKSGAKRNG